MRFAHSAWHSSDPKYLRTKELYNIINQERLRNKYFNGAIMKILTHNDINHNFCMQFPQCGVWWLSGRFGACVWKVEGSNPTLIIMLETLGKSFTRNCRLRFGVLTPTQYQCCRRERL